MTWQDRTREAAYTSPSGVRFVFDYEILSTEFDKNTTAFNFPGINGTYIQDLGSTDRRYSWRLFFWGDDHDIQSDLFKAALRENGRGRLDHPRDGIIAVVPFGVVRSREDLVKSANQTVIEVAFWESTIILYPSGNIEPSDQVLNSVTDTLTASSATFADNIEIDSAVERVSLRNLFETSVGVVRSILEDVVSVEAALLREFNTVADSIIGDLNELIATPGVLADALNILLQIPVDSSATIGSKFDGYVAIIGQFTSSNNPDDQLQSTINDFRNNELFAVGALSSLISSSIKTDFETRSDAVTAAAGIVDQFEIINNWREINYAGLI